MRRSCLAASSYQNVPPASGFQAVLILNANDYEVDMPPAGQTAIVDAFNAGTTGVLFTEWAAYKPTADPPQWTVLSQLLLLNRNFDVGSFGSMMQTYTLTSAHPVWTGLPMSFTTSPDSSPVAFNFGQVINGGVTIASVSAPECGGCSAPGLVVKDGPSRSVHIAHSANYAISSPWVKDQNLVLMITNGAKWAAECM